MSWIYPGDIVTRSDGSSSTGVIQAMGEGPEGRFALVAWITGGETWEFLRQLMKAEWVA
jgi:hypothetical protein